MNRYFLVHDINSMTQKHTALKFTKIGAARKTITIAFWSMMPLVNLYGVYFKILYCQQFKTISFLAPRRLD